MAYAYTINMYDDSSGESIYRGYVKFNVDTTLTHALMDGDVMTISGIVKLNVSGANYLHFCPDTFSTTEVTSLDTKVHKTIPINKDTAFSIQMTLKNATNPTASIVRGGSVSLMAYATQNGSGGPEDIEYAAGESDLCFYYLNSRITPTFGQTPIVFTDTKGYYTTFGAYIQNESNLSAQINATADPLDPEAAIAKYTVSIGGVSRSGTTNPLVLGTYNFTSPSIAVFVSVEDNYGNTKTCWPTSIGFLSYHEPILKLNAYHPDGGASDYNENEFVQRYKHQYNELLEEYLAWPADDGDRVWVHLCDSSVACVAGRNAWNVTLHWEYDSGSTGMITDIGIPAEYKIDGTDENHYFEIATCLYSSVMDPAGYDEAPQPGGFVFDTTKNYHFVVTLTDQFHSVSVTCDVPKAGAYFYVGKNGVAVGMRSTGTAQEKKFEVAEDYKVYFYGGGGGSGGDYNLTETASGSGYFTSDVDTGCKLRKGDDVYAIRKFTLLDMNTSSGSGLHTVTTVDSPMTSTDILITISGGIRISDGAYMPWGFTYDGSANSYGVFIGNNNKITYRVYRGTLYAFTVFEYARLSE